jgi:hypothetical protein
MEFLLNEKWRYEMAMCSMMEENGVTLTMTPDEALALWSCLNGMELNSEPDLGAVEAVLNRGVHYYNDLG